MPSREVEDLLRRQLALSARTYWTLIGGGQTTVDGALGSLVRNAFGSAERLRDAAELLGDEDREAKALLIRACYIADPSEPETSRPRPPPGAREDWGVETGVMRLRGPGGITVEQIEYADRTGHRRRVLRARQHERHLGDFSSVEALATVIDVSALVKEDDDQADEEEP